MSKYSVVTLYDFGDGNGPVPAKQHINGGGWVADTAKVSRTVYVGPKAKVYGNAQISGNVVIFDNVEVYGNAKFSGDPILKGNHKYFGQPRKRNKNDGYPYFRK